MLIDTQALLGWLKDDCRLSGAARRAIASPGARLFFSVAGAWEMANGKRR